MRYKIGFVRLPNGVSIRTPRASVFLTFEEIESMGRFIESGDAASNRDLRRELAQQAQ